jgi:hypothetical protein
MSCFYTTATPVHARAAGKRAAPGRPATPVVAVILANERGSARGRPLFCHDPGQALRLSPAAAQEP